MKKHHSNHKADEHAAEFLSTEDLAARWYMSPGTLANWRSSETGPPFVRLGEGRGSSIVYRLSDIISYEASHTEKARKNDCYD